MDPERFEKAMPGLVKKSGWVRSPAPAAKAEASKRRGVPGRAFWFWMVPGLVAAGLIVAVIPHPGGAGMHPGEEPSEPQSLPPSEERCTADPATRPGDPVTRPDARVPEVRAPLKAPDPARPQPERKRPC